MANILACGTAGVGTTLSSPDQGHRLELLNGAFRAALDRAIARVASRPGDAWLLVGQNAPPGVDPDGEAFPRGKGSSNRLQVLSGIADLDAMARINALRADHSTYGSRALAIQATGARIRFSVGQMRAALGSRFTGIVAAGWVARDGVWRHLPLACRPGWNEQMRSECGLQVLTIPHPSGRNLLTNPEEIREGTIAALREAGIVAEHAWQA
ncbi:hypothetical protein [Pararoseomonas baculiformis]|nr:hypothetical protein [Pararoseomonas baculiformis]